MKVKYQITAAILGLSALAPAVQAQMIEQDDARINVVHRVIENRVQVSSNTTYDESSLPRRSNYSKRLNDMLEQMSTAHERGWLSDAQYSDLKNWEGSVAMEELVMRNKGGGIVPGADVAQLEQHMNGLAYTINREVSEGSRVANFGANPM